MHDESIKTLQTIQDWLECQKAGESIDALQRILDLTTSFSPSDTAWISIVPQDHVRGQWNKIQRLHSQGHHMPLYGVPFAVKDNIDAAGIPTTAACPDFAHRADENATVVTLLQNAGAVLVGKTNLDQFATGLNGTRSPYGAVPNTFDPEYISGGSSSGSASVVARALVPLALGTDTAGSGRVPAGLNNLIGLKPTFGALSTTGVLPACKTLDCVSILALTLNDAELVWDVLSQYDENDPYSRPRPALSPSPSRQPRLAICEAPDFFGDHVQSKAYEEAINKARSVGWELTATHFDALFELAVLLYEGPWVAERYHVIRDKIQNPDFKMDPTVRQILNNARSFDAVDFFDYEYKRQRLTREIEIQFAEIDGLLVPTTPTFPTLQQMLQEPVRQNSLLGTYTNFVNFLGWSALSMPAGFRTDDLPFGLTLIARGWQEEQLLAWARDFVGTMPRRLGATKTGVKSQDLSPVATTAIRSAVPKIDLAVVGAHLRGQPLNHQLTDVDATYKSTTTTSSNYRLYALPRPKSGPPALRKPGLVRVSEGEQGHPIEVEIWQVPQDRFAEIVLAIPAPLGIGKVKLASGEWVSSFLCESYITMAAEHISQYGGWRAFLAAQEQSPQRSTQATRSFSKILVANRGEIAVRLISTIQKMGIKAVAIHSTEDAKCPHVSLADAAIHLPGDSVAETYLNTEAIIRIAKDQGVDAIIPGYGMLSENADFVAACEEVDFTFIGPTAVQIRMLGSKHLARKLATQANVPLVPGSDLLQDVHKAFQEADRIGYPLMIKSSAGGGGIGLLECHSPDELPSKFEKVVSLGNSYFGDGAVFLERLVSKARHIEIQIMGDGYGRVKYVSDRDCSLQRRHQKVIEEAPATLVSESLRKAMRDAALSLASKVSYRGVGTVEFIVDPDRGEFYFLEVNTRLQVEHPVTEAVTGIDLVECMVKIAQGECRDIFSGEAAECGTKGCALEARIYAECPLKGFMPSVGKISFASFPTAARVDTWIETGTIVTELYDPLLAKIIVHGADRNDAVRLLTKALKETQISGIETNIDYLLHVLEEPTFLDGSFTTQTLDQLVYSPSVVEVLDVGPLASIQDSGRNGLWHIGIPLSGAFDNYAMRLANRILGNKQSAPVIENGPAGISLLFHHEAEVVIVGPPCSIEVDGQQKTRERIISLAQGQRLKIGPAEEGARTYLAVAGGFSVPEIFFSGSTFPLGKLGGHNGRDLKFGDLISFSPEKCSPSGPPSTQSQILYPPCQGEWNLRVIAGPHAAPKYFTQSGFQELFSEPWTVDYNIGRTGLRIKGPKPEWGRPDGGSAGLHASNVHDSPYSIGSISFTGDHGIILGPDGPSLGGFVVFCTVIRADLWRLGQFRPGDVVRLVPVDVEEARGANKEVERSSEELIPLASPATKPSNVLVGADLASIAAETDGLTLSHLGDDGVLIEFGIDDFDMRQTFLMASLLELHRNQAIEGVLELTAGVRSIYARLDPNLDLSTVARNVVSTIKSCHPLTSTRLPSRTILLPFAFEDSTSLSAIQRYGASIWPSAPYVPSNADFLKELNDLPSVESIKHLIETATYLVIGLGDVYLGSPLAIPLDPRHRLFGTKYSPPRTFTPEGTVGIGGQYLCIYAGESPGGYQIVGRTVPIWNEAAIFADEEKPWKFRMYDQIRCYPISEEELEKARNTYGAKAWQKLVKVEDTQLDLDAHEAWMREHEDEIKTYQEEHSRKVRESPLLERLSRPEDEDEMLAHDSGVLVPENGTCIRADLAGKCWDVRVRERENVSAGQVTLVVESMKMQIDVRAPTSGRCGKVAVRKGDFVRPGQELIWLE